MAKLRTASVLVAALLLGAPAAPIALAQATGPSGGATGGKSDAGKGGSGKTDNGESSGPARGGNVAPSGSPASSGAPGQPGMPGNKNGPPVRAPK